MDKYYNIAGFLIRVTGEKAEAIQCVCGFEPFEVKPGQPYFTLYLTHEAVNAILPSCPSVFAEDKELLRHICDTISEVLNLVPVWQLECLPDEEAVRLSHTTVFPKI